MIFLHCTAVDFSCHILLFEFIATTPTETNGLHAWSERGLTLSHTFNSLFVVHCHQNFPLSSHYSLHAWAKIKCVFFATLLVHILLCMSSKPFPFLTRQISRRGETEITLTLGHTSGSQFIVHCHYNYSHSSHGNFHAGEKQR